MTPYDRCTSPVRAASSRDKPDVALTASRLGQVAPCGTCSLRPHWTSHYRRAVFANSYTCPQTFAVRIIHRGVGTKLTEPVRRLLVSGARTSSPQEQWAAGTHSLKTVKS